MSQLETYKLTMNINLCCLYNTPSLCAYTIDNIELNGNHIEYMEREK
jgi:hypothetical protein